MATRKLLFVGTYTKKEGHVDGKAKGIGVFELNETDGSLKLLFETDEANPNPSFLCTDKDVKTLHAISETGEADGDSHITAFKIDQATGALKKISSASSKGVAGCFVKVDEFQKNLLVANYMGGNILVFQRDNDGKHGPDPVVEVTHPHGDAKAVVPHRQRQSHAHFIYDIILKSPEDNIERSFVYAADLGLDRIYRYQLHPQTGELEQKGFIAAPNPGAGPRHIAFHPNKSFAYVINELDSTISAFKINQANGDLTHIHTVSTLPANETHPDSTCADIHVHPNGKFLYGSNRGHDSIAIFEINQETGELTPSGHESTRGKVPRNFTINDEGTLLLCANQNSDTIIPFRIDQTTGKLHHTGVVNHALTPVCLVIVSVPVQ